MAVYILINNVNFEVGAIKLIQSFHFIAASTDTAYGLACCASIVESLNKLLYFIRLRNKLTPCLGKVTDIQKWAIVSLLQDNLLLSSNLNYPFLKNDASGLQRSIAFTGANIIKQDFFKIEEYQNQWNKISGVCNGRILGT